MFRHHSSIYHVLTLMALLFSLVASPAQSANNAAAGSERRATRIELFGEASVMAANDLAQVTVFAEASGPAPGGATAQKVKRQIEEALALTKKYPQVAARSSGLSSNPDYSNSSKLSGKAWRVRAQLLLETTDMEALSALVGEL